MIKNAIIVLNENEGSRLKKKITPEDQKLFREAMRHVKPLQSKKEKAPPEPAPWPNVKLRPHFEEEEEGLLRPAPFSDHEYLDPVDSAARIEFSRPGVSQQLMRELRRGKQMIDAILDLHGKTVEEAREALQEFISNCQEHGQTRAIVIHGKGHGKAPPILKNKLNHWLRQVDAVLAFCSARKEEGGSGALYLRLRSKKTPSGRSSRGR